MEEDIIAIMNRDGNFDLFYSLIIKENEGHELHSVHDTETPVFHDGKWFWVYEGRNKSFEEWYELTNKTPEEIVELKLKYL